jgi:hypothetical protein
LAKQYKITKAIRCLLIVWQMHADAVCDLCRQITLSLQNLLTEWVQLDAYDISLAFGGTNVHSRRWRWRPQTGSSEPLRCRMEWRGVLNYFPNGLRIS